MTLHVIGSFFPRREGIAPPRMPDMGPARQNPKWYPNWPKCPTPTTRTVLACPLVHGPVIEMTGLPCMASDGLLLAACTHGGRELQ